MAFSSDFSSAFVKSPGYVCPMLACRALAAGVRWRLDSGALVIDGKRLIGTAGNDYRFSSEDTAARWCEAAVLVVATEAATVARIGAERRAAWIAKKRANLRARAVALLDRAIATADLARRAALVAEARWCEDKWNE